MSQQEVMEFLEENAGEWFTLKEITAALKSKKCSGSFHDNLSRMYKSEVNRRLYGLERKSVGRSPGYKWRVRDEES